MTWSKTLFHHNADSTATDSPGAYLLECAEALLQLSQVERRFLVDELQWIFQRAYFDFSTFHEVYNTWKHCSHKISRRRNGNVINSGFVQEFLDVKTVGRNSRPVL